MRPRKTSYVVERSALQVDIFDLISMELLFLPIRMYPARSLLLLSQCILHISADRNVGYNLFLMFHQSLL